jgi:hypothetical protein
MVTLSQEEHSLKIFLAIRFFTIYNVFGVSVSRKCEVTPQWLYLFIALLCVPSGQEG